MHNKNKTNLSYIKLKWVIILFVTPVFLYETAYKSNFKGFALTMVIFVIYNAVMTYILSGKRNNFLYVANFQPFIDILFVTLIVISRGGLRTDTFILYFLVYNMYTLSENETLIYFLCFLSAVLYGTSCYFFTPSELFSTERLIIRLIYFPLMALTGIFITKQKKLIVKNLLRERKNARVDLLTGLGNRLMLDDFVLNSLSNGKAGSKKNFGLLLIDLDNFKQINDCFGHDKGDIVLKKISKSILKCIPPSDMAFRIGGDEFLIILNNCSGQKLDFFGRKIKDEIEELLFHFGTSHISTSSSIGGSLSSEGTFNQIFKIADERMYRAKQSGKNNIITG